MTLKQKILTSVYLIPVLALTICLSVFGIMATIDSVYFLTISTTKTQVLARVLLTNLLGSVTLLVIAATAYIAWQHGRTWGEEPDHVTKGGDY